MAVVFLSGESVLFYSDLFVIRTTVKITFENREEVVHRSCSLLYQV
jgi:hypothetical protein